MIVFHSFIAVWDSVLNHPPRTVHVFALREFIRVAIESEIVNCLHVPFITIVFTLEVKIVTLIYYWHNNVVCEEGISANFIIIIHAVLLVTTSAFYLTIS